MIDQAKYKMCYHGYFLYMFFVLLLTEAVMGLMNTSAFPGHFASWNCQVQSTTPLQFMWYLNGQLVSNTTGSHMDITASSSYTLTNVSYSDDGSNVRCSAAGSSLVVNSSDVYLTGKSLWLKSIFMHICISL